jgi:hypothetical protein
MAASAVLAAHPDADMSVIAWMGVIRPGWFPGPTKEARCFRYGVD